MVKFFSFFLVLLDDSDDIGHFEDQVFDPVNFDLGSGVLVIHYFLAGFNLDHVLVIPDFHDYTLLGLFLSGIGNNNSSGGFRLIFFQFYMTLSAKGLTFIFLLHVGFGLYIDTIYRN